MKFAPLLNIRGSKVVLSVFAAVTSTYIFFDTRMRIGTRVRTSDEGWKEAEMKRMQRMELQGAPGTKVFMNPHRHGISAAHAIVQSGAE